MSSVDTKTIIITGGIVSGIGKGITSASLGRLLIDRGLTVRPVKADPYLNQDAGTMNPLQHGEVFVTDDGAETDLDLGHYERFLDLNLTRHANFTSGAVYASVMERERDGDFLGTTIQIIPHVTDEIRRRIRLGAEGTPDFLLCELGGTVGDIEALPFIEAVRQYKLENGRATAFVHVVKMDYLYPSDEAKTKPIRHAVTLLRSYGIQPDILIVRCKQALSDEARQKLSLFTGVKASHIVSAPDANSLYAIPSALEKEGLLDALFDTFDMPVPPKKKSAWDNLEQPTTDTLRIGLVGKYLGQDDAYLSVGEALRHAGLYHRVAVEVVPVDAEGSNLPRSIEALDGVIVPGGFGARGLQGKIAATRTARTQMIPFLGICLGLQVAVIEAARNLGNLKTANSLEFDEETGDPVVVMLDSQRHVTKKGGTMRLGSYPADLLAGSLAERLYREYRPTELNSGAITERHRHRFEVNPAYHQRLEEFGLRISGTLTGGSLTEFIELPQETHPFFIATQAHPEFRSRPNNPHPLFAGLVAAALIRKGAGATSPPLL